MAKTKITTDLLKHKDYQGKTLLEILKTGKFEPSMPASNKPPTATITLDIEMLRLMTPSCPDYKRMELLPGINETLKVYGMNKNFERTCFFLANVLHECAEFRYAEEIASGDAYDTRTDLGNTKAIDGDGRKYKGRGDLQCTGRDAYSKFGDYVKRTPALNDLYFELYRQVIENLDNNPFLDNPELVATIPWRTISAGWVWSIWKNLNPAADRGDFLYTVKRINGGYNGLEDRLKYLNWVTNVLHQFKHLSWVPVENYRTKL